MTDDSTSDLSGDESESNTDSSEAAQTTLTGSFGDSDSTANTEETMESPESADNDTDDGVDAIDLSEHDLTLNVENKVAVEDGYWTLVVELSCHAEEEPECMDLYTNHVKLTNYDREFLADLDLETGLTNISSTTPLDQSGEVESSSSSTTIETPGNTHHVPRSTSPAATVTAGETRQGPSDDFGLVDLPRMSARGLVDISNAIVTTAKNTSGNDIVNAIRFTASEITPEPDADPIEKYIAAFVYGVLGICALMPVLFLLA